MQDLGFPDAATRLKLTPDGACLIAAGLHAPRIRVYDLANMSMKFERHLDAEVVDFEVLSDDWTKLAVLAADRSVALHSRAGAHHRVRTPRQGRDLAYMPLTADLVIGGSTPELYRLNLGEGRFLAPIPTTAAAVSALARCPAHGLLAAAGDGGVLELFDMRARRSAGVLPDAGAAWGVPGDDLTALRWDGSGLTLAVGGASGRVALFDLRSSHPLLTKDLMYGSRVVDLKFHSPGLGGGGGRSSAAAAGGGDEGADLDLGADWLLAGAAAASSAAAASAGAPSPAASAAASGRFIISADRHAVKVWDAGSGTAYTALQPGPGRGGGGINDVLTWPGAGLVMVAADTPRVAAYFVPSLGPAPAWCSFLEGLTEELEEEAAPAVYDDYRFVSRDDLERAGLESVAGGPLARPYMHGFFVHDRLWRRAAAGVDEPGAYEAWRAAKVDARLAEARASRIAPPRKLPKVNAELAARLEAEGKGGKGGGRGEEGEEAAAVGAPDTSKMAAGGRGAASLLEDSRFSALFSDPAFTVDPASDEFKSLHPNAPPPSAAAKRLLKAHFAEVEGGGDDGGAGSEGDDGEDSDASSDDRPSGSASGDDSDAPMNEGGLKRRRLFAARPDAPADAYTLGGSALAAAAVAAARAKPLAERAADAAAGGGGGPVRWQGSTRELTFTPRSGGGGRCRGRGPPRGGGASGFAGSGRSASRGGRGGGGGGRGRGGGRGGGGRGRGRGWS